MESETLDVPVIGRAAELRSVDEAARTVEVVWTTGAQVRRYSWARDEEFDEELVVDEKAMRLGRLNSGAPFLNSHSSYRLDAILGVVVDGSVRVEGGVGTARIRFSDREAIEPVWRDIQNGIIRNVSVGYRVHRFERIAKADRTDGGQRALYRAVDWEPLEISAVAIGADPQAQFRDDPAALTRCVIEDRAVSAAPAATREDHDMTPDTTPAAGQETPAEPQARADDGALRAERQRAADITALYQRHGMTDAIPAAIAEGITLDAARAAVLDHLEARTAPAGARSEPNFGGRLDETETRRRGMEDALTARLTGQEPTELGRSYHGLSLVDLAAERLGERRVPASMGPRGDLLVRAFHSTSDFPLLFENALNKTLLPSYRAATPIYRELSTRMTFNDLRPHPILRAGDFPKMQEVNAEGGEFTAGTFSESKESARVKAFGVVVPLSIGMLINDDLSALQQVIADQGLSVALREEEIFFEMVLSGSNADGPTLATTNRQVFNTTDASKVSTGTLITEGALNDARAAIRKRKSLDNRNLGLTPAILLVGPDRETQAQKMVAQITPDSAASVNPFSGLLRVLTTQHITGNAWYVFASPTPADGACFVHGFLAGREAPRFRRDEPFGQMGIKLSLEHFFGVGAMDFRGGFKNPGAAS